MPGSWPCPPSGPEYALVLDRFRPARLLVLPALFDEGNKLRRFTAETMRLLDRAGADSFLPDLPGQNESLAPLEEQTLAGWRDAASAAASHFGATHVLAIRAAAALAPPDLPGWIYAAQAPSSALRALLRARVLSAREAGREETREALLERGRREGLELAGYRLGPGMIAELADTGQAETRHAPIAPSDLGGPGLWLRAEPGHDPAQAERLAAIVRSGIGA